MLESKKKQYFLLKTPNVDSKIFKTRGRRPMQEPGSHAWDYRETTEFTRVGLPQDYAIYAKLNWATLRGY